MGSSRSIHSQPRRDDRRATNPVAARRSWAGGLSRPRVETQAITCRLVRDGFPTPLKDVNRFSTHSLTKLPNVSAMPAQSCSPALPPQDIDSFKNSDHWNFKMKNLPTLLAASIICAVLSIVFVIRRGDGTSTGHVSASGIVFIDNEAVPQADIFLLPVSVTKTVKSYHGHSDSNGQYEVDGGLPPGEYRVVVRTSPVPQSPPGGGVVYQPGEIDDGQLQAMQSATEMRDRRQKQRNRRTASIAQPPPSYSSAQSTTLRVEIPERGTNDTNLYLQTSGESRVAAGSSPGNSRQ